MGHCSRRELALTEVIPGQILAEAACRADGMLMLAAGTVLDAGQLGRLRELGIREVVVVEPAADQAATDPACLAEREQVERAKVEHLFRRSEDDRVTKALFQAVLDHRLGKRE